MPSRGGPAAQVTRKGGFEGFETGDGHFLLYVRGRETPGIWRVPAGGGAEVLVASGDQVGYWRCWRVAFGRIYFATATPPAGPRLEMLDLASGVIKPITQLSKPPDATIPGLAVSPDGRSLRADQEAATGQLLHERRNGHFPPPGDGASQLRPPLGTGSTRSNLPCYPGWSWFPRAGARFPTSRAVTSNFVRRPRSIENKEQLRSWRKILTIIFHRVPRPTRRNELFTSFLLPGARM